MEGQENENAGKCHNTVFHISYVIGNSDLQIAKETISPIIIFLKVLENFREDFDA